MIRIEPAAYRRISAKTAGLDHVSIAGQRVFRKRLRRPSDERSWLQKVRPGAAPAWFDHADEPAHPAYWRREIDAYRSRWLGVLAPGLRTPRLEAVEDDGDTATLWLEPVDGPGAAAWDTGTFAAFFAALGRWQAAFADRVPPEPWLARAVLRRWLAAWSEARPRAGAAPGVGALLARRDALLAELEALPRTLAHHDCWAANLFGDAAEFIVLDWSDVGDGALGEDVANAVFDSVWMMAVDHTLLPALDAAALPAYLSGLRAGGWHGDARLVERAYTIVAALKFGAMADVLAEGARSPAARASAEQRYGRCADDIFAARAAVAERALARYRDGR